MQHKLTNRETILLLFLENYELRADRIEELTKIPQSSVYKALYALEQLGLIRRAVKIVKPMNQGGQRTQTWQLSRNLNRC